MFINALFLSAITLHIRIGHNAKLYLRILQLHTVISYVDVVLYTFRAIIANCTGKWKLSFVELISLRARIGDEAQNWYVAVARTAELTASRNIERVARNIWRTF